MNANSIALLKPASAELKIPDLDVGGYLPVEGSHRKINRYWQRRIAEGSVVAEKSRQDAKPLGVKK